MSQRIRTALFVDFDNIYLGLREDSPEAAEEFATAPDRWMQWIAQEMPAPDGTAEIHRAVLVRQCYLNPSTFGRYRPYFTRNGFSVVDCPPLTTRGKTSTDIKMVMGILDALDHDTRFDEFVVMSGDADFTPVLLRLRMHDRRTAALVSGAVAPAYRAACDLLIPEDTFIECALRVSPHPQRPEPRPAPPAAIGPAVLDAIARRVYQEASSDGDLPATRLPPLFREFPEFTPHSNWLGFFSLRALAEALVSRRPELRILEGDPWRVGVRSSGAGEEAPPGEDPALDHAELRGKVVERVQTLVAESAEPVVMARAAQEVIQAFGPAVLDSQWLGRGTFKNLLAGAGELGFAWVSTPLPGYLYDPVRHDPPEAGRPSDALGDLPDEMASLIRRVHQLTDAPKLTPAQYRQLFEVIAKEVNASPYNLMTTGKTVRDQLIERGESVARQAITFVLRGITYAGYRFSRGPHRGAELAAAFRRNVLALIDQAQAELRPDELALLDSWLVGSHAGGGAEPA